MIKQDTIEKEQVWLEFSTLPLDAQYQVIEFMTFLHSRYTPEKSRNTEKLNLSAEPFVGMWRDREDMQDSRTYVRELRQKEWGNRS
jgi:hypothetical protein